MEIVNVRGEESSGKMDGTRVKRANNVNQTSKEEHEADSRLPNKTCLAYDRLDLPGKNNLFNLKNCTDDVHR